MMQQYIVRHLAGEREELCCSQQLEDESAAMYFNIIHGRKVRRKFTTEKVGERCADYMLVARQPGAIAEREIALFDLS